MPGGGRAGWRRERPGDDLLSAFVAVEERGERLTETELVSNTAFLLFASHETTTNLIGNGMLALFRHPDRMRALRDDPTLILAAIEEFLRYDAPVQYTVRVATQEMEIGRFRVHPGERVQPMIGAANRDPDRFPSPDRFDLTRRENRHLSFGFGIHFCLGAALARLEGEIAFAALLGRFPAMRMESDRAVAAIGGVPRPRVIAGRADMSSPSVAARAHMGARAYAFSVIMKMRCFGRISVSDAKSLAEGAHDVIYAQFVPRCNHHGPRPLLLSVARGRLRQRA